MSFSEQIIFDRVKGCVLNYYVFVNMSEQPYGLVGPRKQNQTSSIIVNKKSLLWKKNKLSIIDSQMISFFLVSRKKRRVDESKVQPIMNERRKKKSTI